MGVKVFFSESFFDLVYLFDFFIHFRTGYLDDGILVSPDLHCLYIYTFFLVVVYLEVHIAEKLLTILDFGIPSSPSLLSLIPALSGNRFREYSE